MNRCKLCNERTDGIGLCYNPGCENYRGKPIIPEPSIQSKLDLAAANLAHADEKIAELQEFIKGQTVELERATAKAKAIDRLAQQFSEEISQAFRKHGLAAGPTALDRVMQQLEEARKARDIAEAKGRWLDGVKACQSVRELARKLPPDILMAPMPFPTRLDYAEKIIQEFLADRLSCAIPAIRSILREAYPGCDDEAIGFDEEWWPCLLELAGELKS